MLRVLNPNHTFTFSRYAKDLTTCDIARTIYPQSEKDLKPRGLWISVDGEDDWPTWCRGQNFNLEGLRYRYHVTLSTHGSILHIATAEEADMLTARYGDYGISAIGEWQENVFHPAFINWRKLATRYAGIIMAPYLWERRLELIWVNAWDCTSGCIWNTHIVTGIQLDTQEHATTTDPPGRRAITLEGDIK